MNEPSLLASPLGSDLSAIRAQAPASIGLYVHVPFCARKCPYCDFNTYAGIDDLHQDFVDALCAEIVLRAPQSDGRPVHSVFLGGGTPTVLDSEQLDRILQTIREHLDVAIDAEITCEANPGSSDAARFERLRAAGVNRLSIGAQSFDADDLQFLGRIHDVDAIGAAVQAARSAGFTALNLDLMFGLPEQPTERWRASLDAAVALEPDHLSLYSLIVEPGTPLHQWVHEGTVVAPDDDLAAEHFEHARAVLKREGFTHYEVSNWARAGEASRHNLTYWRNGDWLACGPGAHGQMRSAGPEGVVLRRYANHRPVPGYIRRMREGHEIAERDELVAPRTAMGESMMLGLRLILEGVPLDRFVRRHGVDPRVVFAEPLALLADWGLLRVDTERVLLSERGLLMGNRVFEHFMEDTSA